MFYPLLKKLYRFLWNLCIYIHCYATQHEPDYGKKHEGHYLTEYFEFRKCLFENIFNDSDSDNDNINDIVYDAILQKFSDFDEDIHYGTDGTLLHSTCIVFKFFEKDKEEVFDNGFEYATTVVIYDIENGIFERELEAPPGEFIQQIIILLKHYVKHEISIVHLIQQI